MIKYNKSTIFKIIYLFIFGLAVYMEDNRIYWIVCLITIWGLAIKNIHIEYAFLISLIIGSEIISVFNIAICILFLLLKNGIAKKKINKMMFLCVTVIVSSSVINMMISGAIYNTIFGLTYYVVVYIIAIVVQNQFDEINIVESIKSLLVIEFFCGFIIFFKSSNYYWGDIHKGSFENAHYFAFWLLCLITYWILHYKSRGMSIAKWFVDNWIYAIFSIVFLYLSDGKNIIVSFILAVCVYCFSFIFSKNTKSRIFMSIIILYIGMFSALLILHTERVENYIYSKYPALGIYVYDSAYSYKTQYFEGTLFDELTGVRAVFGYGIGEYGSRWANLLGYNSMYREDNVINDFVADHFDAFILPNYQKYVSKYNDELVSIIKYRSAVLSYPFSSIIAFLAENGIIGLLFMSYIWGKLGDKSSYGFMVIFLFSSCVFDIYFDHICLTSLILALVSSQSKT